MGTEGHRRVDDSGPGKASSPERHFRKKDMAHGQDSSPSSAACWRDWDGSGQRPEARIRTLAENLELRAISLAPPWESPTQIIQKKTGAPWLAQLKGMHVSISES